MINEEGMLSDMDFGEPVGKSHHVVINWIFNCYTAKSASRTDDILIRQR